MDLDPDWCNDRAIYHELFHVIGMLHEHQRPDRDQYVTIDWNNIPRALHKEFKIKKRGNTKPLYTYRGLGNTMDFPYDYKTIMHYTFSQGAYTPGNTTIKMKVKISISTCSDGSGTRYRRFSGTLNQPKNGF